MDGWVWFWGEVGEVLDSGWGVPIKVVLIIVVSLLAKLVAKVITRRTVDNIVRGVTALEAAERRKRGEDDNSPVPAARRIQRTRSLGRIFDNAETSIITIVAALLIVVTVWPDATGAFALIAAGLGAGIGIGAQGLVKDVINGIFFAVEDQLGIGDVVDTGVATGVVEDLGVRLTQVRDINGTLWFIPNGQIARVGNQSYGWARAVVDLTVPYAVDVDAVKAAIGDAAAALAEDPAFKPQILEAPAVWGITSISTDSIVLRAVVKTTTNAQDDIARELRGRIKAVLDQRKLIPTAVTEIHLGQD